ncbi:hypothetical protein [Pseudoclavibacter sp. VKM Ac-2867]|uniref:hypothetical protein n=1 Tax=Pseudoclavibacter sp. VKM Ac-2867 TaxID=2783829 RepID=UPI00188B9C8A|nr:hypothetical protein [Pseudoclavibacter sp. VKM Ac-2867]MBF4459436.1 hypothetical protein [Pseudoclavibacter sp. VKM Ac-2867]
MVRTAKPPKSIEIRDNDTLPDVVRATHIAFLILKGTKVGSWKHLVTNTEAIAKVRLTPDQQACLDRNLSVVSLISVDPQRIVAVCADCGQVSFLGRTQDGKAQAAPSKCILTRGCVGKPIKTPLTSKAKPKHESATGPEEPERVPAPAEAAPLTIVQPELELGIPAGVPA